MLGWLVIEITFTVFVDLKIYQADTIKHDSYSRFDILDSLYANLRVKTGSSTVHHTNQE